MQYRIGTEGREEFLLLFLLRCSASLCSARLLRALLLLRSRTMHMTATTTAPRICMLLSRSTTRTPRSLKTMRIMRQLFRMPRRRPRKRYSYQFTTSIDLFFVETLSLESIVLCRAIIFYLYHQLHAHRTKTHTLTHNINKTTNNKQGRSLWQSDSGVVRDRSKEYGKLHADEWVLDTDANARTEAQSGEHVINSAQLKADIAARIVEQDPAIKEWMPRLTPEQQQLIKSRALDLVSQAVDHMPSAHLTKTQLASATKHLGEHVRQELQEVFQSFHHENVYHAYNETYAHDYIHSLASRSAEIDDPLDGVDGDSADTQFSTLIAGAKKSDPVGDINTFANKALLSLSDRVSKAFVTGTPAETDPVFNAKPVAKKPYKDTYDPLHSNLGLTYNPRDELYGSKSDKGYIKKSAKKHQKAYKKYIKALRKLHKAAREVAKAHAKTFGAFPSPYSPLGYPAMHPLVAAAAGLASPLAPYAPLPYAPSPYAAGLAPLAAISPYHAMLAKAAAKRARLARKAYKKSIKEYKRTVRYWRRQQRAVSRLRKGFVRAYNKFVKRVRRRHAGDAAWKSALVDLTSKVSQAVLVPTKRARF